MELIDSRRRLGSSQILVALPKPGPEIPAARTLYLVGHPNRGSPARPFLVVNSRFVMELPLIPGLPSHVIGMQTEDVYAGQLGDRKLLNQEHSTSPIVLLASEGEAAEIVAAILGKEEQGQVAIAMAEADGCCLTAADRFQQLNAGTNLSALIPSFMAYGQALTKALNTLKAKGAPKTAARRFFAELDVQSNPKFAGTVPQPLSGKIPSLTTLLKDQRLMARRLACTSCTPKSACPLWTASTPPSTNLKADVSAVSHMMLGLMNAHLGDPTTAAGLAAIEKAFEQFASGGLRVRIKVKQCNLWTTQPSSALYFLFAELAFLACDAGVDSLSWERLANVLVRTQETYCDAYAPATSGSASPNFGDYAACNYCANEHPQRAHFAKLRSAYKGLSLDDLRIRAACNARRRFTFP